jgi:hypothetical protein
MKKVVSTKLLFVIMLSFLLIACTKGDPAPGIVNPPPPPPPPPPPEYQLLYYGGNQANAPELAAGSYEAAARFTDTKIGNLAGKEIIEVQYYIFNKPDSCRIKIYGPLSDGAPGSLLYSADVTSAMKAGQWNVHKLTQTVKLKNEDIWLSIGFKQSMSQSTVGCDPGPALKDGDWLYASADSKWTPFIQRTFISINWTIRLAVSLK